MSATSDEPMVGWTPPPHGRGTLDIIMPCLLIIFLCSWTSVCPNIPAVSEGLWHTVWDKFDLFCLGLLGPEFLLGVAAGQRASALRALEKFRAEDIPDWSLAHSFYADMGGFVVMAPDLERPVPVDSQQLLFLIKKHYVDHPSLSKADIQDKNKLDTLARILAIGQALWFAVMFAARLHQGLHVTSLEVTTISYIICFLALSIFWFHKPSGIARPVILQCKISFQLVRQQAGMQEDDYRRTPLDFVNDEYSAVGLLWLYYTAILQKLRIPLFRRRITSRPHDRISGAVFLPTDLTSELMAAPFILGFSAAFVGLWNAQFPTILEKLLWRYASAYGVIFCAIGGAYVWVWERKFLKAHRKRHATALLPQSVQRKKSKLNRWHRFVESMRRRIHRILPDDDADLCTPLGLLLPVTVFCALYGICRVYLLVADVIGLRALPESAYVTVDWSLYLPRLG